VEKTIPEPQPLARPDSAEEGEISPAEEGEIDLRDVITQSKAKKKKKNKKKK
jgi:hypothetical protein